ncbi:hypothetical protein DSM104299_05165 [Baekduia alba]|uniref:ABC transporter permease n=1 Tax=Baekduia alba TaxID=2997333 RepID=UPI0023412E53|nr:ABC transporter permease [Baekduia alba]WCB96406.1 hypothetical protein DSM104299_05165 [Baekduia alba]
MGLSAWGLEPVRPGRLRVGAALVIYRRRLRRWRWVQDLLAVLGIAAGVALLYAAQVASSSLSGPVHKLNEGIVGSGQLQVVALGATTIPESTYDKIVSLPGVRRAAPELQVPGDVVGPRGQADVTFFGADPRIVKLRGTLLKGFTSADAAEQETVIVPGAAAARIGLKFGNDVRVELDGRRITVPATVADRGQIGSLADTSIVLVPLAYLQRMAKSGPQVSRILVEAEPDRVAQVREELARLRLGGVDVRHADDETRLFEQAAKPTSQATVLFSVLSALVGWLFAVCALLVTAPDRRRLVIQQQRQGFPPSATLKTLLVEAGAIGVVGVVLGLAAGELLSRHGFRSDVSFLSGAFPIGDTRVVTWQSITIAAMGGLLAAVVGVLFPVRELVVAAIPRRQGSRGGKTSIDGRSVLIAVGFVALAAAITIALVAPSAAVVGLMLLALGLACLLSPILAGAITAIGRLNRRSRSAPAVELALHQLRARRWRTRALAITTTGAIAVFGATSLQGAQVNLQAGLDRVAHDLNAPADLWATAPGAGSSIATSTFAPDAAAKLRALPDVRQVSLYRGGLLDVAGHRAWIVGAPIDAPNLVPASQIQKGDARLTDERVRRGGWATVSRGLADALGLDQGDRFVLPAPHPIDLRVAAITTSLAWSSGTIIVNASEFADAWGSPAVAAYQVHLAWGVRPAAGQRQVIQALGARSALRVETAKQRAARQSAVGRTGLSRLRQITGLTLLAAVLAMSAAMTGLLWQHRPVVAGQKFIGLPTGLLWRSLLVETGVLFGVGVLVGAVVGLFGQILATRGVQAVTGYPVVEKIQLGTAATTVGIVLGVSLLVLIVPGYLVARSVPSPRM